MNIVRENLEDLTTLLKVTVAEADYKDAVEKALRTYKRKANLPGFRPGMVPVGLVKKQYGKSVLAEELNKLLQEKIYEKDSRIHADSHFSNLTFGKRTFDNKTSVHLTANEG